MARTQADTRLLGSAKPSNSTPGLALPPGRSQARGDDLPEKSSMASMGRLSRMRLFFQRSTVERKREQPQAAPPQGAASTSTDRGAQEELQAVSTTEADESASKSDPEPDPTTASAGKDVGATVEEFNSIDPVSPISKGAVDVVGGADAALVEIQLLDDTYLKPLKDFNRAVTTLSNIHPYAQAALGTLTRDSQLFLNQANLDKEVSNLLDAIRSVYEFLSEEDSISNIDKDTLARIARTVSDSAHFIKNYSATKSLWRRMGKNIPSETRTVVNGYAKSLEDLMQQYRDRTVRDVRRNIFRIFEDHNLDGMAYAVGAGLNRAKNCLDGTRTEILREIMNWINDPTANAPHILWLHGQAGRGKSAIAHTIASWIKDVGGLGSCFCFARDRQSECREEKILTTIARDLADSDPAFRRALADVISSDSSLKTTPDVMQQWQRLILEPLSKIGFGSVVIVIDALDESGSVQSRKRILSLLTSTDATCFPPNLRILLTSRLQPDIARALSVAQGVKTTSLDDIPMELVVRDIELYVSGELAHLPEIGTTEVRNIVWKSYGLFEWARLACEFIEPDWPGRTIMERYNEITTHSSGGVLLDLMYRAILTDSIPQDSFTLARFHSVMRQIMSTSVHQRLDALNEMRNHFPSDEDHFDVIIILRFMAPLLSGIADRSAPVRPLHPSFYDFLCDPSRSGVYCVDGFNTDMHSNLATASLHTVSSGSESNVCGLEDSSEDEVETAREDADSYNDTVHAEGSRLRWANLPPNSGADEEVEVPDLQDNTLQIELSDSKSRIRTVHATARPPLRFSVGAQVSQQGKVGEERDAIDPHSDSVHAERSEQGSDAFSPQALAEQESAELRNDSPHSEGSKLELTVLPPGEARAERGDPATGSHSRKIEGEVLEPHVFREEVGEEREYADPQSSSREGNESKLETGGAATEREDTNLPSRPPHSESKESEPNPCMIHDTTDHPSVASFVSTSDSSIRKFGDKPSPVPPVTNFRPRRSGILSRFFQRLKSPRGTQEKKRVSPVIVQAAKFKNPLVVAPGKSTKQARNGNNKGRCHPVRSVDGKRGCSNGYRDSQSGRDPSLHAVPTTSSAPDIINEHISDGEHPYACGVIVICGFKLL